MPFVDTTKGSLLPGAALWSRALSALAQRGCRSYTAGRMSSAAPYFSDFTQRLCAQHDCGQYQDYLPVSILCIMTKRGDLPLFTANQVRIRLRNGLNSSRSLTQPAPIQRF
jgi:hypothetical protein